MLRYTGHPVVDVGVATAAAFAEKPAPEQLTVEDLRRLAAYLLDVYLRDALRPYLSCVYNMTSPYLQPSWTRERRRAEAEKVLFAFDAAPDPAVAGLRCVFSGEPATRMAYRHHVPMLTGEGVFNFAPAGLGGLPVAGSFLLAIQAFALGARRCHGRALAVHSPDDPELTYAFAQRFLQENRRIILLASEEGGNYLDAKAPRTLIVHTLLEIEEERRTSLGNGPAPSLTVYHLTNSGRGPDIDIFQLPSQTVAFLRAASGAGTARAWHSIQMAAWERPGPAPEAAPAPAPGERRNYLYEDLFALPANAAFFVRTYFLRRAFRGLRAGDPRADYRLGRELDLVSWDLTQLFLEEVVGMERTRIEAIRTLGDRIADHIASENDRRLFTGLYRVNTYRVLRNLLLKASNARLRNGQPPLIGFDEFLLVFEEGEELARVDWTLARDLVLIRVIEQLYEKGWFGRAPEILAELEEPGETPVELEAAR